MNKTLDSQLSRLMYEELRISPNEASAPGIWRYIACILAPELVRWRFPGTDKSNFKTSMKRYSGSLLRNNFGRLWWRAHLLKDESNLENPYWLIDTLGEDELVAITERSNAAAYKPVAVGLGAALLKTFDPEKHNNRSNIMREAMKRVIRRLPLSCWEALEQPVLESTLEEIFIQTLEALFPPAIS
jgi:hypothetical protein